MEAGPFRIEKIPEISELPTTGGLKPVIRNIVGNQGYDESGLWGFMDYRLSLVWPIWKKGIPRYHMDCRQTLTVEDYGNLS